MATGNLTSRATWGIDVRGKNALQRACKLFEDTELPVLRKTLEDAGRIFAGDVKREAPRHLVDAIEFTGIKGAGANQRAIVEASAPDAARQEFGRRPMPYNLPNRKKIRLDIAMALAKKGYKYRGSKARPYFGIKEGDHAIGRAKPEIEAKIRLAMKQEWERLASGGD